MKQIRVNDDKNIKEEKLSFFEKMKTDEKYNAKVQLIGFGVFIAVLVIYVNIASLGSSVPGNSIIENEIDSDYLVGENEEDTRDLLEKIEDNYHYDIVVDVEKMNETGQDVVESKLRYVGKNYDNKKEILKESTVGSTIYYKLDNRYYSKSNEDIELIEEEIIYDLIDSEYIELDNILDFIDKASLDHVTDYSTGKKEYVYHLKVRDVIVSYKLEDVIEIEIEEENGVLKIDIDYSNLLRVVDDNIRECELEATITSIGEVEEFFVLGDEKNTSIE